MENLYQALTDKKAKICVIGLGYVGLPIALEFAKKYYCNWLRYQPEKGGYDEAGRRPQQRNSETRV